MKHLNSDFIPFQNESQVITWGEFSAENRVDRVTLMGSIDLTKDREGLAKAIELRDFIECVITSLQSQTLVDQVPKVSPTWIKNPFE